MLAMSTSWMNFPLIGGLRKLRNPSWGGHFSGLAHILDSFWIIPKCCHHRPILGAWDETILLIIHADTWDPGVLKFELRVLKRETQLLAPYMGKGGGGVHSDLKPIQTLQKIQKIVLQCQNSPLQKAKLVLRWILTILDTSGYSWMHNTEFKKICRIIYYMKSGTPL